MELNHLQTFVVVAEEKTITHAAQRLFTTPSSISVHIKNLEEELGVQLFVRTPRGMQITEKGQILLEKAHHTLQSVHDLMNHANQMQSYLMGNVALGINASLEFLRIPQLIQTVKQDCPGINLQLVNQPSGHILEHILSESLDLGFVYGVVNDKRLYVQHLQTAQLVVIAPNGWQDSLAGSDWAKLAQVPWVTSDYYCPFQEMIDNQFTQLDLTYQKAIQTNDDSNKASLVEAGVGLSLLEISEAQSLAAQDKITIVENITFPCELSIICLSYRQYDPLIEASLHFISQIWQA